MILKTLELGPMQNLVYLIGCPVTREAIVVDPGWEVPRIIAAAEKEKLQINKVVLTHGHYDHADGVADLTRRLNVPYLVQKAELGWADLPSEHRETVEGDGEIRVGSLKVMLLFTPGHTVGGQCLLTDGHLFSGDTLFVGSCGRCDFEESDPKALLQSLERIRELPDAAVLCPGHRYADSLTAILGKQKRDNPFLRCRSAPEFFRMMGV